MADVSPMIEVKKSKVNAAMKSKDGIVVTCALLIQDTVNCLKGTRDHIELLFLSKGESSVWVLGVRTPPPLPGLMMNIITIIPQSRAHKRASFFGVLFLDDALLKSVALHSSYII